MRRPARLAGLVLLAGFAFAGCSTDRDPPAQSSAKPAEAQQWNSAECWLGQAMWWIPQNEPDSHGCANH